MVNYNSLSFLPIILPLVSQISVAHQRYNRKASWISVSVSFIFWREKFSCSNIKEMWSCLWVPCAVGLRSTDFPLIERAPIRIWLYTYTYVYPWRLRLWDCNNYCQFDKHFTAKDFYYTVYSYLHCTGSITILSSYSEIYTIAIAT